MNTRAAVPQRRPARAAAAGSAAADDPRVRRVRRALVSADAALALAETFSLLGDATRTRILHALSVDELCVSDLAGLLGISASATSHQLRLLRDRRLVGVRREGKRTYYRLQDEHIRTLVDMGLSHAAEDGVRPRS
jgi:DNA-binding transcriptional ArsR family regulator